MTAEKKEKIAELRGHVAAMRRIIEDAESEVDFMRDAIDAELATDSDLGSVDMSVECPGISEIEDLLRDIETEAEFADEDEEPVRELTAEK